MSQNGEIIHEIRRSRLPHVFRSIGPSELNFGERRVAVGLRWVEECRLAKATLLLLSNSFAENFLAFWPNITFPGMPG
jgi:hypothetical protein